MEAVPVIVETTCQTFGRALRVELGDVDGPLADALAGFAASHAVCNACAPPQTAPDRYGTQPPKQRVARLPYADD